MGMTKKTMPETMYRASRCCRVLGNPMAYIIVRRLCSGRSTPGELSRSLQVQLTTVSMTLRHLREMDIVRYETRGKTKEYWIKDAGMLKILGALEEWVEGVRRIRA
jgi:DNA-binding transcriptional ArsR family regulator